MYSTVCVQLLVDTDSIIWSERYVKLWLCMFIETVGSTLEVMEEVVFRIQLDVYGLTSKTTNCDLSLSESEALRRANQIRIRIRCFLGCVALHDAHK